MIKIRNIFIASLLLTCCLKGYSQTYPFDSIPDNLKKGADAVIRSSQCLYTIIKPGNAVEKIRKAVTILNKNADSYRYLAVLYDKYSKVKYIRGTVFDEKGAVVQSLGIKDIFDMSAITGGSFYTDDRMKVMRFPINKYPYTIEYEYEIEYTSVINYPSWSFQESGDISVEKSGIQFVFPKGVKLRYYEQSLKNRVDSVILDEKNIYTWQEDNIPASPSLRAMAKSAFLKPILFAAPLNFEYAGFKGSMSSWKSFGDWSYYINKDRDALPESEIAHVRSLSSKFPDQKDLTKAIYEYMQSKTRYVSIQIGIGGFRTAEAASVAKNGFGDCKALVNYTMALLKTAGIKSYYTLVYAGKGARDINAQFVNNQFNHVILCVPLRTDTVWLECTSQTLPFNYLGGFTSDRYALVITSEGGVLVKTPEFKKEQNVLKRTGSVFVNIIGTSNAKYSEDYTGYFYDISTSTMTLQSEGEMKKDLYSLLEYPDFTVTSAKYTEEKTENPKGNFKFEVTIKGFGTTKDQRIYFNPSYSKGEYLPADTTSLRILASGITIDSITYSVPIGYKVESMPQNEMIENEFGSYKFELMKSVDQIVLYRRLELNKNLIPVDKYNSFRKFFNSIARIDRGIIVLNRQGTINLP